MGQADRRLSGGSGWETGRAALFSRGAALLAAALLSACDGGGGGDDPSPDAGRYTLSGTITAIGDAAVDGDVNDPKAPRNPNNEQSQELPNPVTLGGYANKPESGYLGASYEDGDEFDFFLVPLHAGQNVNLYVADLATGDLDLFLSDTTGTLVDSSQGTGHDETVTAPTTDTYVIVVFAFQGASNYLLKIGAEPPAASHAMRYRADFVPGEVMVEFRESGLAVPSLQERAAALGLVPLAGAAGRTMLLGLPAPGLPGTLAALPAGTGRAFTAQGDRKLQTLAALKALQRRGDVTSAEPNLIRRADAEPDDALYPQQWHYPLINLPQAWDITQGSSDVLVAVIDTGIVLGHPDLAGQFDAADPDGYDFISRAEDAGDGDGIDSNADDPGDGQWAGASSFHGTHVAGTIAARTDNAVGVAGAAWNTRIMPLRVLGRGGGTSYDVMQAIRYAARLPNDSGTLPARAADVINLSLGGDQYLETEQSLYASVAASGVLVAAAAGNNGTSDLHYPSGYDGVFSVAAVTRSKLRAPYSQFNATVDLAAPGGDTGHSHTDGILSTHASDAGAEIAPTYNFSTGTSFATPQVAAVMALMRAVHPALTPSDFASLLAAGAITGDLGAAGFDTSFGFGLIDARKAVAQATALAGGGSPPAPAPRLVSSRYLLAFGPATGRLAFELANAGEGALDVRSVAADEDWLSVTAADVRADGTGRYVARVDRAALPDGAYRATITAATSANTVEIPVHMQVSSGNRSANAGFQYVLLLNAGNGETVAQVEVPAVGGKYAFRFTDVPAGSYLLISGSDQNLDGFICDAGESCGAYPMLDVFEPLDVSANRSGLRFVVGFGAGTNAAGPDAAGQPAPGWRRLGESR